MVDSQLPCDSTVSCIGTRSDGAKGTSLPCLSARPPLIVLRNCLKLTLPARQTGRRLGDVKGASSFLADNALRNVGWFLNKHLSTPVCVPVFSEWQVSGRRQGPAIRQWPQPLLICYFSVRLVPGWINRVEHTVQIPL